MKSQRLANGTPLKTKSLSGDDNFSEEKPVASSHHFLSSASKRATVSALSRADFESLVARIDKAFALACGEKVEESILQPQACRRWLDGERDRYVQCILTLFGFIMPGIRGLYLVIIILHIHSKCCFNIQDGLSCKKTTRKHAWFALLESNLVFMQNISL